MPGLCGDFAWLPNTVLSARDLNVFPISCFAVDIRMFPTSVFCVCLSVCAPTRNTQNTHTHAWDTYIQICACNTRAHTHTGICKHAYSHRQIKPHACRNTCRQGDHDILLKQKLCMLPAETVEATTTSHRSWICFIEPNQHANTLCGCRHIWHKGSVACDCQVIPR